MHSWVVVREVQQAKWSVYFEEVNEVSNFPIYKQGTTSSQMLGNGASFLSFI